MKYVLLVVLAVAVAPTVAAQPTVAYYGVALGSFDYQEDDGQGNVVIADTTDSYRLMVGYQFSEHLAVEGGWGKTSSIRDSFGVIGPGGGTTVDLRLEFQILTVRLLGTLPFDNGVTLLGGVGYANMKQDSTITFSGGGLPPQQFSDDTSGGEATLFAGVQYDWERVAVRLGYETYNFGSGIDVSESSVAFFYKL